MYEDEIASSACAELAASVIQPNIRYAAARRRGLVRAAPAVRPVLDLELLRDRRLISAGALLIVASLTIARGHFSATMPLRVDEAYYWTWSKESVLSFLDHPPMVAWFIHAGTAMFGDTNFGVRFAGLLAMLVMQLLLADIVWRTTHDWRYAIVGLLLPEATLDYGLMATKVGPDTPLIVFSMAMVWSLVRLAQSNNPRWWLLAGLFGGLALLSKYTAVLLLPAIVAFVIVPRWRKEQLSSPYPWLGLLIALAIFSPVLYWNAVHDWISFRFQLDRPAQLHDWSLRFLGEFVGSQFLLVGPILFPMSLIAAARLGWRRFRDADPVAILLSTCIGAAFALLLWRSLYGRIGDGWPLLIWPFGFACTAIILAQNKAASTSFGERFARWVLATALVTGIGFVVFAEGYYTAGSANYLENDDPIGKEAGFGQVAQVARSALDSSGATWFATSDYRVYSMLRWHLRDAIPVVQLNERSRYVGFSVPELAGSGLHVIAADEFSSNLWQTELATRRPMGQVDLTWRGQRYDTYMLQELTNWKPALAAAQRDRFFASVPH